MLSFVVATIYRRAPRRTRFTFFDLWRRCFHINVTSVEFLALLELVLPFSFIFVEIC